MPQGEREKDETYYRALSRDYAKSLRRYKWSVRFLLKVAVSSLALNGLIAWAHLTSDKGNRTWGYWQLVPTIGSLGAILFCLWHKRAAVEIEEKYGAGEGAQGSSDGDLYAAAKDDDAA